MRTRKSDWFDVEENRPFYSFQVYHPEKRIWMNVLADGAHCLYETEEERDAQQAKIRKQRYVEQAGE